MENNKLEHVGVLGMKWGRRRGDSDSGGSRKSGGKNKTTIRTSEDFKAAAKLREKRIAEMSNEDISKVNKRMDLEKRYKDLNPSRVAKGAKAVKSVLGTVGQVAAGAGAMLALIGIGNTLMKKIAAYGLKK